MHTPTYTNHIVILYKCTFTYTAVVGAGHLEGVQKWLAHGGVTEERMAEISGSSKQPSTWPGTGVLQVRPLLTYVMF